MKQNLTILGVEDTKDGRTRTTQAGKPYARVKTDENGWMSCFSKPTWEALKVLIDKCASVEIIESGDFKNITKYYGPVDNESEEIEVKKPMDKVPQETEVSRGFPKTSTNGSMYTSYAKDIFCALLEKTKEDSNIPDMMDLAINLVKQAKEAFE